MIIAVDFDNTLFTEVFPGVGEPIWTTINWLKEQKKKGATLILWTCRGGEDLKQAVEACKSVGLTFDFINENDPRRTAQYNNDSRKVGADIYLEDKCLHPNDLIPKEIKTIRCECGREIKVCSCNKTRMAYFEKGKSPKETEKESGGFVGDA